MDMALDEEPCPRVKALAEVCARCRDDVQTRCSKEAIPLLESVSSQLLLPNHSCHILVAFADVLIDLLNRCRLKATVEQVGCTLARLLAASHHTRRQILSWAEEFFSSQNTECSAFPASLLERFATVADQPAAKRPKKEPAAATTRTAQSLSDLSVLRAAHTLLCADPGLYGSLWDWSCLTSILQRAYSHDGNDKNECLLKWIACQCLAVVCRLGPAELDALLARFVSNESALLAIRLDAFHSSIESETQMALVSLPEDVARCGTIDVEGVTLLTRRQSDEDQRLSLQQPRYSTPTANQSDIGVHAKLPRKSTKAHNGTTDAPQLVRTGTIKSALREVACAVVSCRPVLVTGAVGVGKTLLVENLARLTGNTLVKVQLGNHADSKMLVGSYCCTDIPGKFRWQPGIVSQAVTRGQWLLLEDLDFAPVDIVTLLMPLLQERRLPGVGLAGSGIDGTVKAAGGFRLFATMRLLGGKEHASSQDTLEGRGHSEMIGSFQAIEGLFTKVYVAPPSDSELEQILTQRLPVLQPFVGKIIHLYRQVQARLQEEIHCKRLVSPRDLIKLADRLSEDFRLDCANPEKLFMDAIDCFVEFLPSPSLKLSIAQTCIGPVFNLGPPEVEHILQQRKPEIVRDEHIITIGRCSVAKRNLSGSAIEEFRSYVELQTDQFAPTRVSLNVLERAARCVTRREPTLLVGETGTGKTTVVQHLALHSKNRLVVINLNQQTDVVDLVGGFKPVALSFTVLKFVKELRELLSVRKKLLEANRHFLERMMMAYERKDLTEVCAAMVKACGKMVDAVHAGTIQIGGNWADKVADLGSRADAVRAQLTNSKLGHEQMSFAFIEGSLVAAMRRGDWVLLDEINLAETEMLECLTMILEHGQLILQETGEIDPVKCHPNFRIFACMNPATDVGKKDLPIGIRNRFTELYFEEIVQPNDLQLVAHSYLGGASPAAVGKCVDLYLRLRLLARTQLVDGTGHRPHYSLRTFCRAMRFAGRMIKDGQQADRAIYEGFCLSFVTQLDLSSHTLVQKEISKLILGPKAGGLLGQELKCPNGGKFAQFEGYWVPCGDGETMAPSNYILTDTVRRNLKDLARAVSARQHPVLLQGETSVGKTSMITYLAKCTGNTCVRVNNHEHTDITEYVGQYTADQNGSLVFKEGILVDAMRKGYWIILDELNLACSEILEALNRVLDDNRKLFIAESQTEVTAHPSFMLFATQNPPGTYAGRKVLSRAFRNRFIELHFNELPRPELVTILSKRCAVSPRHAANMVQVMFDLQMERKGSGIFAGKQGFITLRDLFRWAERHRRVEREGFHDWDQLLADEGYMLLAGRVRRPEEERIICRILKKVFKRNVSVETLWATSDTTRPVREMLEKRTRETSDVEKGEFSHLVWTKNARRLAVLVGEALKFDEPVLLVGETGCGKTTIVQLFARLYGRKLFSVNCHMHSETADFIGGLRPCRTKPPRSDKDDDSDDAQSDDVDAVDNRTKLFEWSDGPLVKAMQSGDFFLADEISLADDSVLERLNSLLETERTLFLAEKGDGVSLQAASDFWFASTMNPGGDFGKKELSPALRNRFTEIWCPSELHDEDLIEVIGHNLAHSEAIDDNARRWISEGMVKFVRWFENEDLGKRVVISLRDILSWVEFINVYACQLNVETAFVHGAAMVFLDSLGSGSTSSEQTHLIRTSRNNALQALMSSVPDAEQVLSEEHCLVARVTNTHLSVGPYKLARQNDADGSMGVVEEPFEFNFSTPTTSGNAMRLLRGLGLHRPLLLEGAPGVGKTSIVTALAKQCGKQITRINLSEQTDISDLFGADLPVEGGVGGQFQWRDGPLLRALKRGDWILLDELNLASQSVLEGLNACLDHRGEIFVPELNRTFTIARGQTRIFGCQNPHRQGGGRKGLPKSFLNRFTQVYMEPLTYEDIFLILRLLFPSLEVNQLKAMVRLNSLVCDEVQMQGLWGHKGSPWEFNLRDMQRWAEMVIRYDMRPSECVSFVYADRLRSAADRQRMADLCKQVFGEEMRRPFAELRVTPEWVQLGRLFLPRAAPGRFELSTDSARLRLIRGQRQTLESIGLCLDQGTMCLLVGAASCGKTAVVKSLCSLLGRKLRVLPVTSDMDTIELLGGFEQIDLNRALSEVVEEIVKQTRSILSALLRDGLLGRAEALLKGMYTLAQESGLHTTGNAVDAFLVKVAAVRNFVSKLSMPSMLVRLTRLEALARKHGSLTCGGRFSWIDSPLVRALQEGDWLLIENVNFCAASVLDRLNGLLERNGVLTISEAGVSDGELRTIIPHPDFRLILTMDPANGELSRAMRNRGHEVYMLPLDKVVDEWDFAALLEAKGCLDEQVAHNCWMIVSDLRARGVCGVVHQVIRAIEAMEHEWSRGALAVPVLIKYLVRFLRPLAADIDIEALVGVRLSGEVHRQLRGRQKTVSVENFVRGGSLAKYFEDSLVFTMPTTNATRSDEMQRIRRGIQEQIFFENLSPVDAFAKVTFIDDKALSDAIIAMCIGFGKRCDGYPRDLCFDHRLNSPLAKKYRTQNEWCNTFVFALMTDVLYARLSASQDAKNCDTYLGISSRHKDTLPHALIAMLPTILGALDGFMKQRKSMKLTDSILVSAKRALYAVWQFRQNANRPVRFVERDMRVMAVILLWALKRLFVLAEDSDQDQQEVKQLLRQLEQFVPDLFSRARKLRESTVQSVGMPVVLKNQTQAELFRRAQYVELLIARSAEQIVLELDDADKAVVCCASDELEEIAGPIKERAKEIEEEVLRSGSVDRAKDIDEIETQLKTFLQDLHRYDTNYVLRARYEQGQQLRRHLWPVQEVIDIRKCFAALDEGSSEFIAKYVELAVRSWRWMAEVDRHLKWIPPHIMSTLSVGSDKVTVSSGCETKMHSSAFVFNHPAILQCVGPLVDAGADTTNLNLDYSQMKLKELEEIRLLLWEHATIEPKFADKSGGILNKVVAVVRPILEKNHSAMTDGMARALSALKQAELEAERSSEGANLMACIQQLRAAHLLLQVFTPFDTMDPYEKVALKKEYLSGEKGILLEELEIRTWLQNRRTGSKVLDDKHPSHARNLEISGGIDNKLQQLEKRMAYRPEKSQYPVLAKEMQQYLERNADTATVDNFLASLLKGDDVDETLETWLTNQKNFIARMRFAHPFYRDIVYPFLFGASQFLVSFEALYKLVQSERHRSSIGELLQFPRVTGCVMSGSTVHMALSSWDQKMEGDLKVIWSAKLRECKIELLEALDTLRLSSGNCTKLLGRVDRIISWLSTQYVEYIEAEAERELTKDSLYEIRTNEFKGEENDEVLEAKSIAAMFPRFEEVYEDLTDDRDFLNEDKRPAKSGQASEVSHFAKFTDADLLTTYRILSEIVRAIVCTGRREAPGDIVTCVLERFRLFLQLRQNTTELMTIDVDNQALAAQLIAAASTMWLISGKQDSLYKYAQINKPMGTRTDFYRDTNIAEVVKCQPIIHQIIRRSKELLIDFENHHGLVQVLKVSYRILSQPITSPLVMVITGLVILLNEIEEWNKNVPRNLKMCAERNELAYLITSWRKLELASWSNLLDNALEKRRVEAAKFCLRLQHAISEQTGDASGAAQPPYGDNHETEVARATVAMMETTTTLGDFEHKLEMLSVLASYVKCRGRPRDQQLYGVLSNVHSYYRQFLPAIRVRVQTARQEIQKEIADNSKIVRYKDTSYLAIKQSAEKSHKILHRCLRNFEKVLQMPASSYLTESNNEEYLSASSKLQRKKQSQAQTELSSYHVKAIDLKVHASDEIPYSDIPFYHRLARKYLRKVADSSKVSTIATILDELATEVAANISKLGKETRRQIRYDDKNAQRKAKNLLQRKKKMLVELFRQLTKCGLSYRRGMLFYQRTKAADLIATPLLDEDEVPGEVCPQVCDANAYFCKCVQKLRELQSAMATPSKELELHVVERLQGFGGHLFEHVVGTSIDLKELARKASELRKHLNKLQEVASYDRVPEQVHNQVRRTELHTLLLKLCSCLHQFAALMETIPTSGVETLPKVLQTKELAQKTRETFMEHISVMQDQIGQLDAMDTMPLSERELLILNETESALGQMSLKLNLVISSFEVGRANCITAPYYKLLEEVSLTLRTIQSMTLQKESQDIVEASINQSMTICVKKVLHVVQNVVKAYEQEIILDETDNTTDILNILTEEKQKLLSNLDLNGVLGNLTCLHRRLAGLNGEISSGNLASFVAFMQNFCRNFEHAFSCAVRAQRAKLKLLYLVLSVSVHLTRSGFCIPEEFRDELTKDGATQLQDIEDGGLGEGEGQKDTSDKIEYEEQLEDTHQKGQEQQDKDDENQEDIENEENGIEMSEDFDAKAQGPDEDKNEEKDDAGSEDEEQNKSDLDDQMGDAEDHDPFDLDKEMWDKEQNEDQEDLKSDDEAQGGEALDEESQMVAKDNRAKEVEKEPHNKQDEPPPDEEKEQNEINKMDDSYEGEKEDPYKSGKEKGLDEDNEVEDFELPDEPSMIDDEDDSDGDKGEGEEQADAKQSSDLDEGEADNGDDTEVPAEDQLPDLPEEIDDPADEGKATKDTDGEQENDENSGEENEQSQKNTIEDPTTFDKGDGDQPKADEAEGMGDMSQEAVNSPVQRQAISSQTNEDAEGSGEGQASSAEAEGVGQAVTSAHKNLAQVEGDSREREKRAADDRKMAANESPRDKQLVSGAISEAVEREKQSGKEKGDAFEHQPEGEPDADNEELAADMATDQQAEQVQPMAVNDEVRMSDSDDDSGMEDVAADDTEVPMDLDEQHAKDKLKALKNQQRKDKLNDAKQPEGERGQDGDARVNEGDLINTVTVQRGNQAVVETRTDLLADKVDALRLNVQAVSRPDPSMSLSESQSVWAEAEMGVTSLVQELCEQLRLVLEPTKTSKLKGDYRTGKRLNMRKVIDYVASGYRKDKIWMKRTKPNKRQYQIMLAVDDSASMADSKAKEMTFETVALLAKALSLLEAGDLSVASFGEDVSLIHPLGQPFSSDSGPHLVRNFTFAQTETKVSKLISFAADMFEKSRSMITGNLVQSETAQLLIIVSDGRLMSEGTEVVRRTIQRAREAGIFVVYIILDNPSADAGSVMEMRSVSFEGPQNKAITRRYMETFPFPFYVVLRELDSMPVVLGEALRQWFELVTAK